MVFHSFPLAFVTIDAIPSNDLDPLIDDDLDIEPNPSHPYLLPLIPVGEGSEKSLNMRDRWGEIKCKPWEDESTFIPPYLGNLGKPLLS